MPWSPVPKFPDIIQDLRSSGYKKEATIKILTRSVMRITGLIRTESIKRTIQAMEELGYIRVKEAGGVFEIYQDQLYNFPIHEKDMDKIENMLG